MSYLIACENVYGGIVPLVTNAEDDTAEVEIFDNLALAREHRLIYAPSVARIGYTSGLDGRDNAAFIVHAVNAHAPLVEVSRTACAFLRAFGGDIPDWLEPYADALSAALNATVTEDA